jgi:hypothetical protein
MSPDERVGVRVGAGPNVTGAVTHGTRVDQEWMDLLVADDDWVRREFDELVAAAWGGSRPPCPRIRQGAHEPRRSGPRSRPTRRPAPTKVTRVIGRWRTAARAPPRLGTEITQVHNDSRRHRWR